MKFKRRLAVVLLACAASTFVAFYDSSSAPEMTTSAQAFLASLSPDQLAKAKMAFGSEERFNWHFIPRERKGLPMKEMRPDQRALAHAMLSAGLSQRGAIKAATIIGLEKVLGDIEKAQGRTNINRDPELYFFTVFGDPSNTGTWGWRVEGHHLSINVALNKGKVAYSTPTFFGANPASIVEGPRAGMRPLGREEDLARDLLMALDSKQRTTATIDTKAPNDIITTNSRKAEPGPPVGLSAAKMTQKQADMLMAVIEEYAHRMPMDVAQATVTDVRQQGLAKVSFAWAGSEKKGDGHYYRIHGPTFLIEYDNTQNNANHIHSVWRDLRNDFGADLLKEHYVTDHQAAKP